MSDQVQTFVADAIVEMKQRLRRLANKNHDEWKTTITVDEKGYHIEVVETADDHTLTDGHGATLADAIKSLWANMPDALKAWGYKDIK